MEIYSLLAAEYAKLMINLSIAVERSLCEILLVDSLRTHELLVFMFLFTETLSKLLEEKQFYQDEQQQQELQ